MSGPHIGLLALAATLGALAAWVLRGSVLRASADAQLAILRGHVANRDADLLGLKGRFRDLEARAASLDAERQGANAEIVSLANSLDIVKAANTTLRLDADAWKSRHTTIATELGSTAAALAQMRTQHATLTAQHTTLEALVNERATYIAALEAELQAARELTPTPKPNASVDDAPDWQQLKNELATAKRHLHEKASALTTAEGRIVDAFREIERLRATIRERTAERDEARARLAALNPAAPEADRPPQRS